MVDAFVYRNILSQPVFSLCSFLETDRSLLQRYIEDEEQYFNNQFKICSVLQAQLQNEMLDRYAEETVGMKAMVQDGLLSSCLQ